VTLEVDLCHRSGLEIATVEVDLCRWLKGAGSGRGGGGSGQQEPKEGESSPTAITTSPPLPR
jgi:hypothetical protein